MEKKGLYFDFKHPRMIFKKSLLSEITKIGGVMFGEMDKMYQKKIDTDSLGKDFKVMGHKTRLDILLLATYEHGGATTKDIMEKLKLNRKTYNFHIYMLKANGFVETKRTKINMFFKPSAKALAYLNHLKLV